MARDNQRQRVYDAERAAGLNPLAQTIPNADLQGWVDDVLDRRIIRSRWGARKVRVELTRGRGGAYAYGSHTIRVTRLARNEAVLLHEIAHTLTDSQFAPHGPEYAGVLLFLVKNVLGAEAHGSLFAQMRAHKVRRSNAGIPAVRSEVPAPRAARERELRALNRDKALHSIRKMVARGQVSWAEVERLAREGRVAARRPGPSRGG